jgi:hypothetical protein
MTETTIKSVKLKDLSDLNTQGRYLVVRMDSPDCIYKRLNSKEDEIITVDIPHRSSWDFLRRNSENPSQYYPNIIVNKNSELSDYYKNGTKIHIDAPLNANEDLGLVMDDLNWYQTRLHSDTKKIRVSYERRDNRQNSYNFVKENGKYFVDVRGYNIPVVQLRYNYGKDPVYRLSYSLGRVCVDLSTLSREDLNAICEIVYEKEYDIHLNPKAEGVAKLMKTLLPLYDAETDFLAKLAFRTCINLSKRTFNSVKFSVVLNKVFGEVTTQEEFREICSKISLLIFPEGARNHYSEERFVESILNTLEDAREIKKASIKKKSTGAFNKIMQDLDFVTVNKDTHPLTHEAVFSGDIPLGTFFRKDGDSYFVYNDNWDLWEAMLKDYREEAIAIAGSCSGRTTYEKDIMSYFYFTLYELPEYLEQQTGRKWKGIPKLVNSANELDPPKEGDNGVAKTRSALTPIVDNENGTVTVPYVSMKIGGYQTTYCYGLSYSVLKRGFTYKGNTVMKNVEEKVNGRDDYGLMFYTLTGTSQGRGYPTFLIIFEKLDKGYTKVHFHRTHPMRSKGGDYNPIHNWTVGCYKWMIGNVNFERIKAQQGDLAFVEIENFPSLKDIESIKEVDSYDNHRFEKPVTFAPYTKKDNQNVLGYVQLMEDTVLSHNEHMNRIIPKGNYEIRQCRSWEANPKGIWSLRID